MNAMLLAVGLLLPVAAAIAQPALPAPAPAATQAQLLQPFVADYEVFRGGKPLGAATMRVVRQSPPRWRVDLTLRGTHGLLGLAGIHAEQSTTFDAIGETYRPLTQATVTRTLFTQQKIIGNYDWPSQSASWQGDVKARRAGPLALQTGDMSGLLINLAIIRDAQPGARLRYRFVDNGRVRNHEYVVAAELESVAVAGIGYMAMRVDRVEQGNEETVVWVVKGVPTPIRMLQREAGEDTFDLRLVDYRES